MTAGYGPQGGSPVGPAYGSGDDGGRPGPLPPRMEPPRAPAGAWPAPGHASAPAPGHPAAGQAAVGAPVTHPPAGGYPGPAAGAAPAPPAVPGPRTTWSPAPQPGAWGAPATPANGPAPTPAPGGWNAPPAAQWPPAGTVPPGMSAGQLPPGAPASRTPSGRRGRAVVALIAVLVLVTGVQAFQIYRLSDRLGDTDRRLKAAQASDGGRLGGLEQRADALEKQAGAAFNPEAIASAVLPSVFRVKAGQFTGTAFAVGKPAAGGGTNLFTNFHVVEAVWDDGGRQVFLERTDQRFPATIVKVDKENDIAHLTTTGKFTGLVTAATPVKSGQQIVVVGAPLGLEDSVTTGVVSAFRKAGNGSGPVVQFDAPINPGNSGGPVINGAKQVVGIATAKARDAEGIGLAVPIKTACDGFKIC